MDKYEILKIGEGKKRNKFTPDIYTLAILREGQVNFIDKSFILQEWRRRPYLFRWRVCLIRLAFLFSDTSGGRRTRFLC